MYFRMYQDTKPEWRWTLYAKNHEPIACSSEGYQDRTDCFRAIQLVKESADAPVI